MCWIPSLRQLFTLSYTNTEAINHITLANGGRYSHIGVDDFPSIAPESFCRGSHGIVVTVQGADTARRAGMPRSVLAVTGTQDFANGAAVSTSAVNVDAVASELSGAFTLPTYTLLNVGVVLVRGSWTFNDAARNITDERYPRANLPNLDVSLMALPVFPRQYQAYLTCRW